MDPSLAARARAWLRSSRRHQILAATVVLGILASAVAVPVSLLRGGGGQEVAEPRPSGCDEPPAIEPLAAGAAGAWRRLALPPVPDCYRLTAAKSDATGVAPDSGFVLVARGGADPASLAKRIRVEPALKLTVRPAAGSGQGLRPGETAAAPTRFRVTAASPMRAGNVYRFTMLDAPGGSPVRTWAFQVQSPLRVVAVLPADHATDVPLDIGIELTFSHDGVTGVEDRLRISPPTQGRLEIHKRVAVFVPKKLEPRRLYTVTLRPGVSVEGSGETIEEPFTFRFETGSGPRGGGGPAEPALQFTRSVWESAISGAPVLGLYGGEDQPGRSLPVAVYRFPGAQEFLSSLDGLAKVPSWAGLTRARFRTSLDGLVKAASFTAKIQRAGRYGDLYVVFPEPLPAGFYIVQAGAAGSDRIQAWLQVTDLATYASVSAPRTLVWVNDVAAGAAVAGATIRVAGGDFSATTGADGVALFETPKSLVRLEPSVLGETASSVRNLTVTAPGGRTAVVPLSDILTGYDSYQFRENVFPGNPSFYWRFLYTDRHLYRPTDTVHFWGLVRRRAAPARGQKISVEVGGWDQETGARVVLGRTTVTATAMGTFIGRLPIEAASPGYYDLEARVGDQTIASTYLEVADFVKPAYKIDVTSSKKAVFEGDPVRFDIRASFFDGTPVPGTRLSVSGAGGGSVVTDADGRATVDWAAEPEGGWEFASIGVTPALAEEGDITGGTTVRVFPSAVTIDADAVVEGGAVTVTGTLYRVDMARLNSDEPGDPWDVRAGPAPGRPVRATAREISYRRVEEGESYDFVNKRVVKTYRYEREERTIPGERSATSDSKGRFRMSFPAGESRSYEIDVTAIDESGRSAKASVSAHERFRWDAASDAGSDVLHLSSLKDGPFRPGDEVRLTMLLGAEELPSGAPNRYLFLRARNGIQGYGLEGDPTYAFSFSDDDVPNVTISGVRFTGGTYQEVAWPYEAVFDRATRKLSVSVSPDRARYRPGDTSTLNVRVTDAAGTPARAEVMLGAVDEAIYRLEGQNFLSDLGILDSLYELVPAGVLRAYVSHQSPRAAPAAEQGGEGGARSDFKDVALFDRVQTGGDGRASIRFKVPDNLTSWRVSALAVTQDLHAGSTVALVPVGLPVFADLAMSDTYLTSDRPLVRLRAFGDALRAGDPVSFEVSSGTLIDSPLKASGRAFEPVDVALPPLREGRHEITVRVSAGGRSDALVRPVTVLPSRLVRAVSRFAEVGPGERFSPERTPDRVVTVTLSDHNRGRYYPVLLELSWTGGDRVDQRLARDQAQEMLAKNFREVAALPEEFVASRYQTPDGGVAIFPFAGDDLGISARVAALAPDRFGRQGLARYFRKVVLDPEETRERAIQALYGLSALGEPVLTDVQRAAGEADLSSRERLYVGLAAAVLGDQDTATRVYRGLLGELGEQRGAAVRLRVGRDQDDVLEATSLAAILGAALADDAAPALFQYTLDNSARERFLALEQISFLALALPRLSGEPVGFAYSEDGSRVEKTLERGESLSLRLTPAKLRALDLRVGRGTLGVATSLLEPFDAAGVRPDRDVSIARRYNGRTESPTRLRDGSLVRISLEWDLGPQASDGCYQVSDLLPSGLRPVTRLWERGIEDAGVAYPYSIEGQRVSFCVSRSWRSRVVSYYARVVGLGDYTAEPVVMQSQKVPESMNATGSVRVEIR
ncbi:MAG: Ig-like domain-containing protein [Acidobacteria bacterium]|nr:Ig-like domain-containing protein [Acidobacteriota bacterium]